MDSLLFTSRPAPDRHPDRLATLAYLFDMQPCPPDGARILELGCGDGSNLLALAMSLPKAHLYGIDLSEGQIEKGRTVLSRLGLTNISLNQADVRTVPKDLGEFDYIVCHGLYSWVEVDVQRKLLEICSQHLTEHGVAYISFNCAPGWNVRGAVHAVLQATLRDSDDAEKRVEKARSLINFMLEAQIDDVSPYGMLLRHELENLHKQSAAFLLHELCNPHSTALSIGEFLHEAERHSLQYLADARVNRVLLRGASALEVSQEASNFFAALDNDTVGKEQLFDCLIPRTIRGVLLCHARCSLSRIVPPDKISPLFVAAPLEPPREHMDLYSANTLQFQNARGPTLEVSDPILKVALMLLASSWPEPLSIALLAQSIEEQLRHHAPGCLDSAARVVSSLCEALLSYYALGLVELTSVAPRFKRAWGERPEVSALARVQSEKQEWVTNLRHEFVVLEDVERHILQLLDGNRTIAEVVDRMAHKVQEGDIVGRAGYEMPKGDNELRTLLGELVQQSLHRFAEGALLVDEADQA